MRATNGGDPQPSIFFFEFVLFGRMRNLILIETLFSKRGEQSGGEVCLSVCVKEHRNCECGNYSPCETLSPSSPSLLFSPKCI